MVKAAAKKSEGNPRNYTLQCGVYRFGRSKMYHKKAIYKFLKKKTPKVKAEKKATIIKKEIGGVGNGGFRMVRVKRLRNDYPTVDRLPDRRSKNFFSKHERKVRPSLKPGVIVILLAGVHKGKRVVVLKHLASGLLLITGPFSVNGCPLRRVNQRFVIATSTKIDISDVKIPEDLDDEYFRAARLAEQPEKAIKRRGPHKGKKEASGNIFESKKSERVLFEDRKVKQATVDSMLLDAIKKHSEGSMLKQYLRHSFGLSKGQYPHNMLF